MGKREEKFRAHRRRVVAPAPWDATPEPSSGAGKPTAPASSDSSDLISIHRQRLEALEKQVAFFGPYAPPHVTMEIDNIKRILADLEA